MAARTQAPRLDIRLSPQNKDLIARAAEVLGLNMTAFTTAVLTTEAQRILDERTRIVLSDRDRDRFISMLDNPPPVNAALRRAFEARSKSAK
jgi:uncharacterized protein (DUF1778 family)